MIPAIGKPRQEDFNEFEAIRDYIVRHRYKKQKQKKVGWSDLR